MSRFLFIFFFGPLLWSCGKSGSGPGQRPANLLPEESMAKILTQVHLNEARISKYALRSSDSSTILFNRLQTQVLKRAGVDTSAYRQSYIYYSARPEELARIYERVVEQLKETQKAREKSASKPPVS